jgi:Ser/Thr protein kinase RdoA (MazF antagonist)
MNRSIKKKAHLFHQLEPELVLGLVEEELGLSLTNLFRPMTSYINKVYELERRRGGGLIVKFYRPGRWTDKALLDEHAFLLELADREIPVVPPLKLKSGATLGSAKGLRYAIFAKRGGRSHDEYSDDQWLEIGRLLGRIHSVGAVRSARHRVVMAPDHSTARHLRTLLDGDILPDDLKHSLQEICTAILDEIRPLFAGGERIRIHGDCHFANLLQRPGEPLYLIDFDDMAMGPPVQDLWMLLPGRLADSLAEVDLFLQGYETFRRFDRRSLRLIEPLRAMRYIHYMAWCAHQVSDDGDTRAIDDFGSAEYWQREIKDLHDQLAEIRRDPSTGGNLL